MSYAIVNAVRPGMPSWPKDAKPRTLIALHDTEGAPGKAGALGTIAFLVSTAAQRQASYHEIWAWEDGALTVYLIVPADRVAGSIGPQPVAEGGHYAPDAWATKCMGAAVWDPNQVTYAVSIAGTRAYVDGLAAVPEFVAAARERLHDLSRELGIVHLAEHFRFQNDRTDWGTRLTPALGGLTLTPEEDAPVWINTVTPANELVTLPVGRKVTHGPDGPAWFTVERPSTVHAIAQDPTHWLYVAGAGGVAAVPKGDPHKPAAAADCAPQLAARDAAWRAALGKVTP